MIRDAYINPNSATQVCFQHRHGWKTEDMFTSLLVSVILRDRCPVGSDIFEVVEQRSDLFLYVSLRKEQNVLFICVSAK